MKKQGIILKTIPYKENSKIVYFFTEEGKVSAIARGAKKIKSPLRIETSNLSLVSFELSNNSFPTLVDISVDDSFKNIQGNYRKNFYANYIADYIYHNQDLKDKKLYDFFVKTLKKMNEGMDEEELTLIFEIKYLYFLGSAPNLKSCFYCGTNEKISGFSIKEGSVVCKNHLEKADVSFDLTLILLKMYYTSLDDYLPFLTKDEKLELREVINRYYDYHVGYCPKLRNLINKI